MRKLIVIFSIILFSACNQKPKEESHENHNQGKEKIYTCPMHPEIVRNEPGQCPICGMDLVEKISDGEKQEDTSLSILLKPVNTYVISQIKTVTPEEIELPLPLNVTGIITYDTREIKSIAAKTSGWIEKLYVKFQFQEVSRGQKLFDIYSRELSTDQEHYIFLLTNDAGNMPLIAAAEKKLLLQGFTTQQIEELKRTKNIKTTVSVFSPYTGHLHNTPGIENESSGMNMPSLSVTSLPVITEGMAVKKGQTIFNIYGIKRVWAVLDIPSTYIPFIKNGTLVNILYENEKISGRINFIEKEISDRKTRVRVFLDNTNERIKIGTLVKATLQTENLKGLFVPAEAVVHLGVTSVVFVKKGNTFYAKRIQAGNETNGKIQIIDGLNKYYEIAANGQMLIDSESFIREPYE